MLLSLRSFLLSLAVIGLTFSHAFAVGMPSASAAPSTDKTEAATKRIAEWELDEDGLRQWKEAPKDCGRCDASGKTECERCDGGSEPECGECKKGKAKCRGCGGKGKGFDPLEEMICSYCDGSALWSCGNCDGDGTFQVTGGSKKGQKCGPCGGSGSFKCEACKGKRFVNVAKVGRRIKDAKESQLETAREKISEALGRLKRFKPGGDEVDNRRQFEAAVKDARGVLPGLKNSGKLVEVGIKALRGSAQYVGYERMIQVEFKRYRDKTQQFLGHQMSLIDECLEVAKFNHKIKYGE